MIINTGYINYNNTTYRYILKEFVKGKDFYTFLLEEKNPTTKDWISLLTQLGNILGTLHSFSMGSSYGLLREGSTSGSDAKNIPAAPTWQKYIDKLMTNRKYFSKKLDKKRSYRNITGVDIQNIFKYSYKLYKDHRNVLTKVTQPFLIHYDMLFKNIIVSYNIQLARWEIVAIIDNEWASAGDPDIDLIQIENAAYFSSHKEVFRTYWNFFTRAYVRKKTVSKDIENKRLIYHMMRSLFYLIEVYGMDQSEIITRDTKNIQNIEANYLFLERLINSGKVDFSLYG